MDLPEIVWRLPFDWRLWTAALVSLYSLPLMVACGLRLRARWADRQELGDTWLALLGLTATASAVGIHHFMVVILYWQSGGSFTTTPLTLFLVAAGTRLLFLAGAVLIVWAFISGRAAWLQLLTCLVAATLLAVTIARAEPAAGGRRAAAAESWPTMPAVWAAPLQRPDFRP